MKIYKKEEKISELIKNNIVNSEITYLNSESSHDKLELIKACEGNACAFAALKDNDHKITDDVMPISSILVTDIWNANNDVFTAEEIIKAAETPIFKPINWMHRGSEDTENENIGVMIKASLVSGDLPEINHMTEDDLSAYGAEGKTLSGSVHIKQDGVIWSQYFPTYASKVKNGISEGNIYVSMECFFEDFGYCLRKNEDDANPLFIDRTEANAHMSNDLTSYGGNGTTKYKGKKYQIGRWLKNIIFSGQGIVFEPANKRKGKILSIIINDNKATADITNFDPAATNPPTAPVQAPGTILNPQETTLVNLGQPTLLSTPTDIAQNAELPKTYQMPEDGLIFYTSKEASKVGEIELGCTGYHLYMEDRHSDNPLLYAKLMGDPSDLESQMKIGLYRPCDDERELRFILQEMAKKGIQLKRFGKVAQTQTTSFQPSVPGGGGETITNSSGTPTSSTDTGQPGGQDLGMQTNQGGAIQGSENNKLIDKAKSVYDNSGDIKLSNINEQEIEDTLDLAVETIDGLIADQAEYELAIAKATSQIEKLNKEIVDLKSFAESVEKIADRALEAKTFTSRKKEMNELLGEDFLSITDKELMDMDEKAYGAFKSSVLKIAKSIDDKTIEIERANAAAISVAKVKKPETNSLVIAQDNSSHVDTAGSLIGFAFSKKR